MRCVIIIQLSNSQSTHVRFPLILFSSAQYANRLCGLHEGHSTIFLALNPATAWWASLSHALSVDMLATV